MADAGVLSIRITADDKELIAALANARRAVKSTADQLQQGIGAAVKYGAALATAGGVAVSALVAGSLQAVDSQAKLARQIGGTTSAVQGLERAADLAGVSQDTLSAAANALNVKLGQAMRGAGTAGDALESLNLTARQLAGLDADERLALIADRIRDAGLNAQQTSDVLRQLGIRQAELINLFEGGGDAIRNARREVDQFGVSVSEIEAAQIEAANDAMTSIGFTVKGVSNQIAVQLAPILQEIGDRFAEASRESGGFKGEVTGAIESVARAVGFLADMWRGLTAVVKGAEVIALGFTAAVASTFEGLVTLSAKVIDQVIEEVNDGIRALNNLPGVDIGEIVLASNSNFVERIHEMGSATRGMLTDARSELHDLATQPMPSDQIDKFFEAVRQRSTQAAEQVVETCKALAGLGGVDEPEPDDKVEKDELARREQQIADHKAFLDRLEERVEAIRVANATETELAEEKYATDLEQLNLARENELLTEETWMAMMQETAATHSKTLEDIKKRNMTALEKFNALSWNSQVAAVTGALTNMTAGVATESKKMFELNKAAGIANAVISAYQGIALTLATYPFPLSAVMAAVQGVAAFAQVNAIRSASFGGGGGAAPSLAGGTAAPPVSPVSGGAPATGGQVLSVEPFDQTALFDGKTVRVLAERLVEHQRDGGTVVFA